MIYELGTKKIKIPDDEIEKNCKMLEISKEEAIQMYLEDEGYLENAEVAEMTAKAKANKTDKVVATDKTKARKKAEREPKANPVKEDIIKKIAEMLENSGVDALKISNPTKIIEFSIGNRNFKVDLVEKRQPKAK